jgi:hypothetical protein
VLFCATNSFPQNLQTFLYSNFPVINIYLILNQIVSGIVVQSGTKSLSVYRNKYQYLLRGAKIQLFLQ